MLSYKETLFLTAFVGVTFALIFGEQAQKDVPPLATPPLPLAPSPTPPPLLHPPSPTPHPVPSTSLNTLRPEHV
jgi:hypothetical protein